MDNVNSQRLNVFAGTWKTSGQIYAIPSTPAIPIHATDIYEWLEGNFFLIHRWNSRMGDERHCGIEIIGYNEPGDNYLMHSYNNDGSTGIMYANLNNDSTWTFKGETERCAITINDNGNTLNGRWERADDGINWQPWMEVKLVKQQ